jgi:hypothetical protein
MTTGLQADVDSFPAGDVVAVTMRVSHHLELATAARDAGNKTTRSPARATRARSSPSSRRSPRRTRDHATRLHFPATDNLERSGSMTTLRPNQGGRHHEHDPRT